MYCSLFRNQASSKPDSKIMQKIFDSNVNKNVHLIAIQISIQQIHPPITHHPSCLLICRITCRLQCCSGDIQCSGSSSLVMVGAVCGVERGETETRQLTAQQPTQHNTTHNITSLTKNWFCYDAHFKHQQAESQTLKRFVGVSQEEQVLNL